MSVINTIGTNQKETKPSSKGTGVKQTAET
jgi:hypothetical protein